jgi:hypothetical protein
MRRALCLRRRLVRTLIGHALGLIAIATSPLAAQQQLTVAVIGFKTSNVPEEEQALFNNSFVRQLAGRIAKNPMYPVKEMDRRVRDQLLEEIEWSVSELSIRQLTVGKMIPADLLLVGTVTKTTGILGGLFRRSFYVTLTLVGVETGRVVAGTSGTYSRLEDVWSDTDGLVRNLFDREIVVYTSLLRIEPDPEYTPSLDVRVSGKRIGDLGAGMADVEIPSGNNMVSIGDTSFRFEFIKDHQYVLHPYFRIPEASRYTSAETLPGYISVPSSPDRESFNAYLWLTIAAGVAALVYYTPSEEIGLSEEQFAGGAVVILGVTFAASELLRTGRNAARLREWERTKAMAEAANRNLLGQANYEVERQNQRIRNLNRERGFIRIVDTDTGIGYMISLSP